MDVVGSVNISLDMPDRGVNSGGCGGVTLPPTETIEEFAGQLHPFLQGNDDTKQSRLV